MFSFLKLSFHCERKKKLKYISFIFLVKNSEYKILLQEQTQKKKIFRYATNFMNVTKLLICLRTDTWDWFDPVILGCMYVGREEEMQWIQISWRTHSYKMVEYCIQNICDWILRIKKNSLINTRSYIYRTTKYSESDYFMKWHALLPTSTLVIMLVM